jgi:serine/threonine protein kinase
MSLFTQKIGDFGYSRRIDGGSCSKLCGTVFYLSPEIVKDKRRLLYKEADVWALGICLLILITKKEPYSAEHFKDITAQILKAERTPLPHVSPELDDLMQRLLDVDPSTRITLD